MSSAIKRIIGLSGSKGVGKSTFASQMAFDFYRDGFTGQVRIMSFATPLKQMLGCIVNQHFIENKEEIIPQLGVSARHCLQTLGTEWGRNLNPDIWVNLAKHRIEESTDKVFIIDDVRFDNEAKMIRELGGSVWNLTREGIGGGDSHVSEFGVSKKFITKEVELGEATTIKKEDTLAPNEQEKGKRGKGIHEAETGLS